MSAAPSWPLICVAPAGGRTFRMRGELPPSGLNLSNRFARPNPDFRNFVPISFFGPSKRKTTRGALTAPARHNHSFRGLQKARNLTVSQRLAPGTLPPPSPRRVFLLPSRYGAANVGIRGLSLRIPTHFCVHPAPGRPGARFLHNPGVPGPGLTHLLKVDLRA